MKISSLAMAVVLLAAPAAAAADVLPEKVRKAFQYFVGDWSMTGTVAEGAAESTVSVSWAPGEHMLVFNSTWSDPDSKSEGSGIFGWDAVDERVHTSEFWSDGWYHHRHYKIESDTVWVGEEFAGATDKGERIRSKVRIEIKNANEWTYKTIGLTRDGKRQTNANLRFRRMGLQSLARLIGRFDVSFTRDGEVVKGIVSAEWAQDKRAIKFFVDLDDLTNHSVIGWDSKREVITCMGFINGEKIDQVWDVFGSSIVVIEDDQVVFKFDVQDDGSITGAGRDGTKLTFNRRSDPTASR